MSTPTLALRPSVRWHVADLLGQDPALETVLAAVASVRENAVRTRWWEIRPTLDEPAGLQPTCLLCDTSFGSASEDAADPTWPAAAAAHADGHRADPLAGLTDEQGVLWDQAQTRWVPTEAELLEAFLEYRPEMLLVPGDDTAPPFCMDRRPVNRRDLSRYAQLTRADGLTGAGQQLRLPIARYLTWAGKRAPTDDELVRAAAVRPEPTGAYPAWVDVNLDREWPRAVDTTLVELHPDTIVPPFRGVVSVPDDLLAALAQRPIDLAGFIDQQMRALPLAYSIAAYGMRVLPNPVQSMFARFDDRPHPDALWYLRPPGGTDEESFEIAIAADETELCFVSNRSSGGSGHYLSRPGLVETVRLDAPRLPVPLPEIERLLNSRRPNFNAIT